MSHWSKSILGMLVGFAIGFLTFQAFRDKHSHAKELPRILIENPLTAIRDSTKPKVDHLGLARSRIPLALDLPVSERLAALRALNPNLAEIQRFLTELCKRDSSEALEFAQSLWPEHGVRDFAIEHVLKQIAKTDAAAAFTSLLRIDPPPSTMARLNFELGKSFASAAPDEALKATENWNPRQRKLIVSLAVLAIAREDPARAMELVPEGDERLLGTVVTAWLETDPDKAMTIFESLPDGSNRNQALGGIARYVHRSNADFEITKKWIAELDESDRQTAIDAVAQTLQMNRDLEKFFELDVFYTNFNKRDADTLSYAYSGDAAELETMANWLQKNDRLSNRPSDNTTSSVLFSRLRVLAPERYQSLVNDLPDGTLKSRLQQAQDD